MCCFEIIPWGSSPSVVRPACQRGKATCRSNEVWKSPSWIVPGRHGWPRSESAIFWDKVLVERKQNATDRFQKGAIFQSVLDRRPAQLFKSGVRRHEESGRDSAGRQVEGVASRHHQLHSSQERPVFCFCFLRFQLNEMTKNWLEIPLASE